jgi:CRISPR-associated protein Cmr1
LQREPTIHLETVTPAFIGTSDAARAEWSAKGIRGELRWWFRAVAGGELRGDADNVREMERSVFGGIGTESRNDSTSALRVLAQVGTLKSSTETNVPGDALGEADLARAWNEPPAAAVERRLRVGRTNPLGYLGYGPMEYSKTTKGFVYKRGRIAEGSSLLVTLQWNRQVDTQAKNTFDRALWCWINLGGIGARSRRGYGSLVRMNGDGVIQNVAQFKTRVVEMLSATRVPLPAGREAEWTHFTSEAHVYHSHSSYKKWSEAMRLAGAWMIAFRRRYGAAFDERSALRNRDYEWLKSDGAGGVPDRAGFGLPLPFGRETAAWGSKEGRRASPLLIHIARFGAHDHYVVFTHIPARLVPDGQTIAFKRASSPPTVEQKNIVRDFLEDLKRRHLIEEVA